jgi:hypothetical protein
MSAFDFTLEVSGPVTSYFLSRDIRRFTGACEHVRRLPYGRNLRKHDILCVIEEGCGTCSTKHALLWQLARENNAAGVRLMQAFFMLGTENAPSLAALLMAHGLQEIPEAHNYLRTPSGIVDCTGGEVLRTGGVRMLDECEVTAEEIVKYKVTRHREYLRQWLTTTGSAMTLDEAWNLRESCIRRLSGEPV